MMKKSKKKMFFFKGVTPICEDYARIHNGGPNGCNSGSTDEYWSRVSDCCNRVGNCDV